MNESLPLSEHKSNSELRRLVVELRHRNRALMDLLKWVGPRIQRRNANGAIAPNLCLICVLGIPQYKRMPCRHNEVWALIGEGDDAGTQG